MSISGWISKKQFTKKPIIAGNFSTTERFTAKYTGVAIMLMVSKKLKKHITSPALHEAAQTWTTALDGRGISHPQNTD